MTDEAICARYGAYLTAVLGILGSRYGSASVDQLRSSHAAGPPRRWAGRRARRRAHVSLGLRFTERVFPVVSAQVRLGDRLLLYSDGVTERRTIDGGRIGENGLRAILAGLCHRTAATTVRGLQDAVINASPEPLRDDATLLVLAPHV